MEQNDQDLELEKEQGEGEEVSEKPELTPEQLEGIKRRKFTKLAKELGIELPKPETDSKIENKKEGLDYGKLTYLETKGVSSDEDIAFVEQAAKEAGIEIRELFSRKWFTAELKERQETRATKEAIPEGKTRGGQSHRDSVEYWIAKGELPPSDQVELRRKVVNAKIKNNENRNKFASSPVKII